MSEKPGFVASISSADFWLRLLYILLFAVAWQVSELLLLLVVILQVGFRLFQGAANARVAGMGNSLSQYVWQIGRYVSGATEQKPWPFMEWPAAEAEWQRKPGAPAEERAES